MVPQVLDWAWNGAPGIGMVTLSKDWTGPGMVLQVLEWSWNGMSGTGMVLEW